jgi:ABC-2 type transport system permease protein
MNFALLRKYGRLYSSFFKASFIADMEYRVNFLTRIFGDVFWYLAQIVMFETLYLHTSTIGTWDVHQTRVFLGLLFVVDAIYMVIFSDNLDRLTERVRKGEMDLLLTKPVDSQFMLSCQRVNTALLGNLLIATSWLIFALVRLPGFDPMRLLWLMILLPTGVVSLYTVRFVFGATAIIFTRSENLQFMWYQVYKLGMRPDKIYFPWLKFLLLTLFPVGIVASVPARALLDPPTYFLFLWAILWTATLLWLSHRFWNFCLKFYSSASS